VGSTKQILSVIGSAIDSATDSNENRKLENKEPAKKTAEKPDRDWKDANVNSLTHIAHAANGLNKMANTMGDLRKKVMLPALVHGVNNHPTQTLMKDGFQEVWIVAVPKGQGEDTRTSVRSVAFPFDDVSLLVKLMGSASPSLPISEGKSSHHVQPDLVDTIDTDCEDEGEIAMEQQPPVACRSTQESELPSGGELVVSSMKSGLSVFLQQMDLDGADATERSLATQVPDIPLEDENNQKYMQSPRSAADDDVDTKHRSMSTEPHVSFKQDPDQVKSRLQELDVSTPPTPREGFSMLI